MVRHNSLSWGQCEVPRPVETTQMEKYRQRRNTLGAILGPRQPVRSGRPRQPQEGRMERKVGTQASDKWETMQILRFNSVWRRRKSWALCTGILNKMPNCIQTVWRSTPHFALRTSHSTPRFTLHTSHIRLHTPHFTHSTRATSQSPLHTSHFTLSTPHFTLHTPHHTPHFPHHTPHFTLQTSDSTLHAPHSRLPTSHSITLHTLHSTLRTYTRHSTLHTLHFTLHTLKKPQMKP